MNTAATVGINVLALEFLKSLAALTAILALIFGLAYLLKRLKLVGPAADAATPGWRMLGIKTLGPKRQIYVMEVGTKLLLIGVTDKSMNRLMEIGDPAEKELVLEATSKKKTPGVKFQDFLRRAQS
jgi:flagellar biosynthetic protein FliO